MSTTRSTQTPYDVFWRRKLSESERKAKILVAEVLGVPSDSIHSDAALNVDPRWDSLAHVCILTSLEETGMISVDPESVDQFTSLRSIARLFE